MRRDFRELAKIRPEWATGELASRDDQTTKGGHSFNVADGRSAGEASLAIFLLYWLNTREAKAYFKRQKIGIDATMPG